MTEKINRVFSIKTEGRTAIGIRCTPSLELCGIILEFNRLCSFIYCILFGNESGSGSTRY